MEVIPAIDIRKGRCVRLYQGDYQRETVYFEDPLEAALHWQALGALRLHVVDLDGAAQGIPVNLGVIGEIARIMKVPVQAGGGIRKLKVAAQLTRLGVARIVLGTSAVEDPAMVVAACHRLGPEAVVVGVDARDGYVAVQGWKERTSVLARDLVKGMADQGVVRFIYTDIARDGTMTEPNFPAIAQLVRETGANIVASGGISSVEHLKRLSELGVESAIVGMALYTGAIDLPEALEAVT